MARKRHKPEKIVTKLRKSLFSPRKTRAWPTPIRSIGVTEVTYYRWRQEFGELKSDQVKRQKRRGGTRAPPP